jgi:hypothetical protein
VLVSSSAPGKLEYFTSEVSDTAQGTPAPAVESNTSLPDTTATAALPSAEALPEINLPGLPSAAAENGLPSGTSGLPSASGLANGSGTSSAVGKATGEATVELFGVQGTGNRFVYVFDRSSSMRGYGGRPLAAAKSELIRSLTSLDRIHQFQIIFYNETPHIFQGRPGQAPALVFADEAGKQSAATFVQRIAADGGTEHMDALLTALRLAPDVIFFLTDANEPRLTAPELVQIHDRNRRGTVIHCIEFGAGPSTGDDNFLQRLARQNRGGHAYVDVTRLPAP